MCVVLGGMVAASDWKGRRENIGRAKETKKEGN